jgi:hypothetical protein
VEIPNKFSNEKYYFDMVFDEKTDQKTIFEKTTLNYVHDLFKGNNSLIFGKINNKISLWNNI